MIALGRRPSWLVGGLILVLSVALVRWARTRPGFDPYGWLVWGRQTLDGNLDTNGAPSWKPLPYLFTIPYALAGHYKNGQPLVYFEPRGVGWKARPYNSPPALAAQCSRMRAKIALK